jgi:hypothetical protein
MSLQCVSLGGNLRGYEAATLQGTCLGRLPLPGWRQIGLSCACGACNFPGAQRVACEVISWIHASPKVQPSTTLLLLYFSHWDTTAVVLSL